MEDSQKFVKDLRKDVAQAVSEREDDFVRAGVYRGAIEDIRANGALVSVIHALADNVTIFFTNGHDPYGINGHLGRNTFSPAGNIVNIAIYAQRPDVVRAVAQRAKDFRNAQFSEVKIERIVISARSAEVVNILADHAEDIKNAKLSSEQIQHIATHLTTADELEQLLKWKIAEVVAGMAFAKAMANLKLSVLPPDPLIVSGVPEKRGASIVKKLGE